ncbi:histone H2A-beta, sperm-like [Lucilia sericata]|uniref:histone H2A-beta, sperm-like n=1 Tax=Lucilia sericata TaxID=13632 RepID=UPI0018A809FB|nr:histone H2A-beta, sperm-like [Lucilia sericata]
MEKHNKKSTVRKSRSKKANLKFPVARIHRYLRKGRYAERIGETAPVFLCAVLEYLTSEVIELAGNIAIDGYRKIIEPRDIKFGIELDPELRKFLPNITIPNSEKLLYIEPALLNNCKGFKTIYIHKNISWEVSNDVKAKH